jgi:hypothetical protein
MKTSKLALLIGSGFEAGLLKKSFPKKFWVVGWDGGCFGYGAFL